MASMSLTGDVPRYVGRAGGVDLYAGADSYYTVNLSDMYPEPTIPMTTTTENAYTWSSTRANWQPYSWPHSWGTVGTSIVYGSSMAWDAYHHEPEDRLREMLRERSAPRIHRTKKHLPLPMDHREACARQTLRRIIGDAAFKRFVRDGFITVNGASGRAYVVHPGSTFTKVYNRGVREKDLCVVMNGGFTPTDSVITRYLLILSDEEGFRQLAISHSVQESRFTGRTVDQRKLTEVFSELKRAAA